MDNSSRLEQARQSESETTDWYRSPIALIAGLVLFVGALALIAMAASGGDDTTESPVDTQAPSTQDAPAEDIAAPPISFGGAGSTEVGSVNVEGVPLPALVADEEDAALGMVAPVVTANSLTNGAPVTLQPGKARVIGFFAHWCPHCQAELPELTSWLADNELPPNTEFIAISTIVDETRSNYPPSAWFSDVGWASPVLVDDADGTLLGTFGFGSFPAFVAIDSSGTVIARAGGNVGPEGFAALFGNFAS